MNCLVIGLLFIIACFTVGWLNTHIPDKPIPKHKAPPMHKDGGINGK